MIYYPSFHLLILALQTNVQCGGWLGGPIDRRTDTMMDRQTQPHTLLLKRLTTDLSSHRDARTCLKTGFSPIVISHFIAVLPCRVARALLQEKNVNYRYLLFYILIQPILFAREIKHFSPSYQHFNRATVLISLHSRDAKSTLETFPIKTSQFHRTCLLIVRWKIFHVLRSCNFAFGFPGHLCYGW